jgi:predicted MFS family arabinose efflux permease
VAAALLLIGLSFVQRFGLAAAVLMALGFAQIMFMTSCNTTVQIAVPDDLRGRIMGLYALVFAGMTPIGALLMGAIAERWGVAWACAVGGAAGLLLVSGLTLAWYRRRRSGPPTGPGPGGRSVP